MHSVGGIFRPARESRCQTPAAVVARVWIAPQYIPSLRSTTLSARGLWVVEVQKEEAKVIFASTNIASGHWNNARNEKELFTLAKNLICFKSWQDVQIQVPSTAKIWKHFTIKGHMHYWCRIYPNNQFEGQHPVWVRLVWFFFLVCMNIIICIT